MLHGRRVTVDMIPAVTLSVGSRSRCDFYATRRQNKELVTRGWAAVSATFSIRKLLSSNVNTKAIHFSNYDLKYRDLRNVPLET